MNKDIKTKDNMPRAIVKILGRYPYGFWPYVIVTIVITGTDRLFGSIYIVDMTRYGISSQGIGLIASISALVTTITNFPSGVLADTRGRAKVLAWGLGFWSVGLMLFGLSHTLWAFVVSITVWALGVGVFSGIPQTWLVDTLSSQDQGNSKRWILPNVSSIAQLFGALCAALSAILLSWRLSWLFGIQAAMGLGACLVVVVTMRENYGAQNRGAQVALKQSTRLLLKSVKMRLVLARSIGTRMIFSLFVVFWQVYLLERLHGSARIIGPLMALLMIELSLGIWFARSLMKHFSPFIISALGSLLVALGAIVATHGDLDAFYVGGGLIEVGLGIDGGAALVWIQDLVPTPVRAAVNSGIGTFGGISSILAPLIGGWLIRIDGFGWYWKTIVILALVDAALCGSLELFKRREAMLDANKKFDL